MTGQLNVGAGSVATTGKQLQYSRIGHQVPRNRVGTSRSKSLTLLLLSAYVFCIPCQALLVVGGGASIARVVGWVAMASGVVTIVYCGIKLRPTIGAWFVAVFLLWNLLSVTWSVSSAATISACVRDSQLAGMVLLCWAFISSSEDIARLFASYTVGASLALGFTIWNFAHGITYLGTMDSRYVASGFDPNEMAIIFVLGVPMAVQLSLDSASKSRRHWAMMYLPAAIVGTVLTGSRTGSIALTVALLFSGRVLLSGSFGKKAVVTLLAGLSVALIMIVASESERARVGSVATETFAGTLTEGGLSQRFEVWNCAWQLFREYPFFGVGAGAFAPAVARYYGKPIVAHNTYISILVETGTIGFALCTLMIVVVLSQMKRIEFRMRRTLMSLVAVLSTAFFALTWEGDKSTWLVLALLLTAPNLTNSRWANPRPLPLLRRPISGWSRCHTPTSCFGSVSTKR